ncbi:MAG: MFS transporter [Betaproteobacteria bacterium]|nr:MAG: MFS transporter [Betaproteobacteria bacterium]
MTIYLVVVLAILGQAGFGGSRVAVSLYALELGASQFTVGVMIGLYSLCPLLFSIVIGRMSDRVPPGLPMAVGAAMMVAALLLPAASPHIVTLCATALLLGLGHLVFDIPLEANVGGVGGAQHRARNYALITMAWSIANFIGPLIAGFCIDTFGYRYAFWALAGLAGMPILILWAHPRLLPHTVRGAGHGQRGSVADLWRISELRATFIAGGIIGSAQNLFQFYMPVYGHAVGLSASAIGTVLGTVALAAFVIRAIMPLLTRRVTEHTILKAAIYVAAFAYLLLPFFANAYVLSAIAFVLGLGVGSAQPMIMSLLYALAPAGRIAEATGVYKTLRGITQIVIPVLFGSVGAAFGPKAVFLSNTGVLLLGGYLQRNGVRPRCG